MRFKAILDAEWAIPILRSLPPQTRQRLKQAMTLLEADPYATNPDADIKRLETGPRRNPVYRLRVGQWRIIYACSGSLVKVIRVMHREEGYAWLDR